MNPSINTPVLLAHQVNGRWVVDEDTWKGNLPSSGYQIVTPQEAQQLLQENISNLNSEIGFYTAQHGAGAKTVTARQGEVAGIQSQIQKFTNYSPKVGGVQYVIGPNGNLMTEANAKNYISPEEGLSEANKSPFIEQAPTGTLASATVGGVIPPTISLQPGSTNTAAVKQLQDYLVSQGLMTQAQVDTGYGTYGPQTTAAVKALQEKLGVDNKTGVGYFGPRTIAAVGASPAGGGGGTPGTGGGANDPDLTAILQNPNLTPDQKAAIQAIFGAVESNDADTAARIQSAMKAASEFSDPYFKAQIRLATDALSRGLSGKEGDLAFAESEKRAALEELKASTAASKDYLSFQHQQELKNLETKYQTDIETTQQNLAATGFTSSSRRARAEQILGEQNTGLVESSKKQYGYQTGNLDRSLASSDASTVAAIANLQRLAAEGKLDLLRSTEQSVGSANLPSVSGLNPLGDVGGTIPRQQATDAFAFASNFVF